MIYFQEIYNQRKNEIKDFIELIIFLEGKNDQKVQDEDISLFQWFFNSNEDGVSISYQSMVNIMKSNVALMLYNIIEYTVSGLIDSIYYTITSEELSYIEVNDNIQKQWRKTILKTVNDPNTNYNTILRKNEEMIYDILNKKTLSLQSRNSLPGGNLDGTNIKKVLEDHGVSYNPSAENYRPDKLRDIKIKRNELAHGSVSFTDALRDSTIGDIDNNSRIIFLFLEDLITTVVEYKDNGEYRCDTGLSIIDI